MASETHSSSSPNRNSGSSAAERGSGQATSSSAAVLVANNGGADSTNVLVQNVSRPHEPTLQSSLHAIVFHNFYINLLLIAIPIGIASGARHWSDSATFIINFIAIIPLAKMLDMATDELSKVVGQAIGALINASFGNAIELIVGILALKNGLLKVVQASLLGSILSNLLFVLGFCFLLGGIYNRTLYFSARAANASALLLAMTILEFLIPATFSYAIGNKRDNQGRATDERMVIVSHATAILLVFAYIAFLVFQLVTHQHYFRASSDDREHGDTSVAVEDASPSAHDDDEDEESLLTPWAALGLLIGSTVVIAICAEYLVDSIEGISVQWGLSETFIGLIIIPIVGNAAEHVTAVSASIRNKAELAIGVALGSSMQIALFVTPLLVIVGWITGNPLTLNFPLFDTSVLFVVILIVNHLVNDGESNWLEGFMLLLSYIIIAVAYFYIGDESV